ncbi:signal recognition particle receptor subunit alpha [Gammaproteobacteria bacterium]|nr:signal recognition particle receptor subunit alpha [Gammaproteobacteria bacterium]
MYRFLASKLSNIFRKKHLTEADIDQAIGDVKNALIDADVAYAAIEAFTQTFSKDRIMQARVDGLDPQAQLMDEVRKCLLTLLTDESQSPTPIKNQLHTIVLVGLQGAGKTTTCAKIANHYREQYKVMVCSTDIYRPAAMAQLEQLAAQIQVTYFAPNATGAVEIAQEAQLQAKQQGYDILIIDTAGRLNIDEERMQEAFDITQLVKPQQCLYVVDTMIGQSALEVASTFHKRLALSGIILTKTDSDAKGGVALSVRHVTQKPIRWIGTGEHIDQLALFNPEQAVEQILDMGDLLGLAKKAEKHINQQKAQKTSNRMLKGEFSLDDMLNTLEQIKAMGGMKSILQMLPGSAQIPQQVLDLADQQQFSTFETILKSMTQKEKNFPSLVLNNQSRIKRILKGSGRSKAEFNNLKKSFEKIEKTMQKMRKGKFKNVMQQFMNNGLDQPFN